MKKIIFLLIISITFTSVKAQADDIFSVVEEMPLFNYSHCEQYSTERAQLEKCSMEEIMSYLGQISYPEKAKKKSKAGKVFIKFVIDTNGNVINTEVAKSSGHKLLDETALNHIASMPNWRPGKQRGKYVKVQYVVPINFKL